MSVEFWEHCILCGKRDNTDAMTEVSDGTDVYACHDCVPKLKGYDKQGHGEIVDRCDLCGNQTKRPCYLTIKDLAAPVDSAAHNGSHQLCQACGTKIADTVRGLRTRTEED